MSMAMVGRVSLEQAKSLVELLETGQQEKADALVAAIQNPINSELFAEIGKLTRQLHDSLTNFQLDSRLNDLATAEIPDAKERLNYVITRTEEAANKTMDAVESIFPVIEDISSQVSAVKPAWSKLMNNEIDLKEFKSLCVDIDSLLITTGKETAHIHGLMTDVLMAQDFQDLTGQVIRKVIDLVREVEESLINMLTAFGISSEDGQTKSAPKVGDNLVEGPIVNKEKRNDIVEDQDDVDDLLSSLGF
ncbi:protein phosphatase CheZ [Colwellia sp. 4_MG-2023]|jgi:chemotaxis protein CheZ|uniref:protein phosphatase CheZ n=1 Tax=unclassified Colwellia TaxID=196834 RepID=UPI001C080041|nr:MULTISPECIES: protein phosphatase CheZ [unclassified Colwellia]MBU2925280.1 protein phosphatase CheZ [Colwellia sp. C2M11]MDO6486752.1 protein phosphatase CheZ [Colwellia sp. 6_MG-2023]MDO6506938.1 protein phosphatase CheZ [Colwellia sp. 5_MG-2023]MDO6556624.1 protein phosphatase CheZ [Colwellia sp. 4_MG-2023]MDO6651196.1 protein phosphatase CheZ [Colwellia sp. 3_MG-2023]